MLKETNNIKMSSSCLTRGSSAGAHNTKAYHASGCPIGSGMTGESGRSMIEMLGVLAIIGVLSVGGIAGYTSAMNKHRANELLNQVSMRATSVMAQVEFGNAPNVDDFGDYDGYSFTAAANPDNAKQFTITISGISGKKVPKAVCQNMKNTVGSNVRNFVANCDGNDTQIILTYNNDMGTTVYASDYNGDPDNCPGKYCTGSNTCVDTGAACTCSGTQPECKVCDAETGSYIEDSDQDGNSCNSGAGTCQSGECVAPSCSPACTGCQKCNAATGKCVDDSSKCDSGKTCFSGHCMNSSCVEDPDWGVCVCSATSQIDPDNCDISKPYCSSMNECLATVVGNPCSEYDPCFGDAPYCNGTSCVASIVGMYCNSSSDCNPGGNRSEAPFCNYDYSISYSRVCGTNAEDAICESGSDCTEDYPYCLGGYCKSTVEGYLCASSSNCSNSGYGNIASDAPYCDGENRRCSSSSDVPSPCNSYSDCSSATPYCVQSVITYSTYCVADIKYVKGCSSNNDCNGITGYGGVTTSGFACNFMYGPGVCDYPENLPPSS